MPTANKSIVRHVLYLEGFGRDTPYLSTTEDRAVAGRFAGKHGAIWATDAKKLRATEGTRHISRKDLLQLLKGKGKGDAIWTSAYEVAQARRYVEESREHLISFVDCVAEADSRVSDKLVAGLFEKD